MYKLLTTARGCDGLHIGFHRDRDTRQRELINNKRKIEKKIMSEFLFLEKDREHIFLDLHNTN